MQLFGESCVFKDWKDALIVPVPKKDDLQFWNNWRGISLWMLLVKFLLGLFRIVCR